MANLKTTLCGVTLHNPLITASGAYGFGREYEKLYPLSTLGGISCKGTTLAERLGNPPPRIAETPAGMLNSVGLQNPGVDKFIGVELPYLKTKGTAVIANIAGSTVEEYAEICERLSETDVDIIEVNISCPNVKAGGAAFGVSCDNAAAVTRAVRKVCKKPILIKLSPNVTDIASIAKAVEAEGADAVSLINTLLGMRIDIRTRRPVLHNNVGGLSGPAVFPVALRMVYQVYEAVHIPVIGMGGVSSAEDVIEMMLAGAAAVEVGAANLVNPFACRDIIRDLPRVMEKYGMNSLREIIGGAHHG